MGPLVCMSPEKIEISVSTERMAALTTHQECGDVIFLTPVETCRASTSTLAMMKHMVIVETKPCTIFNFKIQDS